MFLHDFTGTFGAIYVSNLTKTVTRKFDRKFIKSR